VLGVEVGVIVGSSKVNKVSIGIGVEGITLGVGVPSVGWMEGKGVSVTVCPAVILHEDNAIANMTTTLHKKLFIHSSFSRGNLNALPVSLQ
jgi:hypothetical protein